MIISSLSNYNGKPLLESLMTFNEHESLYLPTMVNIVYNNRLDKDLIKLESFMEYADMNNVDDAGRAIYDVCMANRVSIRDIGFMVEEASILADDDILATSKQLKENGIPVFIEPISTDSTYYRALEDAIELDENYSFENSYNFIAYCEAFAPIDKAKEIGSAIKDRVSKNFNSIKSTLSEAPENLAKKLSAIKKMISEKNKKLRNAAGNAKIVLKNQISKLKKGFSIVKEKLAKAKNAIVDTAGKAKDKVVTGAKSAGGWVADKAGGVRDTIVGAKRKVFG